LLRPFGQSPSQLARILVVARHRQPLVRALQVALALFGGVHFGFGLLARWQARRAHENDGVVDLVAVEATSRLEILGKQAQRPCIAAGQKRFLEIRLDGAAAPLGPFFTHEVTP
jgi:hypothetical protein